MSNINVEEWTSDIGQNNELPYNEINNPERGGIDPREQRNQNLMEALKKVPEYKGVLDSLTLKNGDEILVFERGDYISGFQDPVIGRGQKAENLRVQNHTISQKPEALLQDDDSIHIFSKYGLTTLTGVDYTHGAKFSLSGFEKRILPIILALPRNPIKDSNAVPVGFYNLEHYLEFRGRNDYRKVENARLFSTFHISNGLFGNTGPSFLPLLGKRLGEASKEKEKRREEAQGWWEEEEAKRAEEERMRIDTPEDVLRHMRGEEPQVKPEEQTNSTF